jgi:Zn-dependent alcohol dehydrogenase
VTARSASSQVLSAKQMGAGRIIAMSRHESRQKLAREFGATDIVTERGGEGVARIDGDSDREKEGFMPVVLCGH